MKELDGILQEVYCRGPQYELQLAAAAERQARKEDKERRREERLRAEAEGRPIKRRKGQPKKKTGEGEEKEWEASPDSLHAKDKGQRQEEEEDGGTCRSLIILLYHLFILETLQGSAAGLTKPDSAAFKIWQSARGFFVEQLLAQSIPQATKCCADPMFAEQLPEGQLFVEHMDEDRAAHGRARELLADIIANAPYRRTGNERPPRYQEARSLMAA